MSEFRQQPVAFAIRGKVKPTAGDDVGGAGPGKAAFVLGGILSKEINQRVELSGYAGYIFRGEPDAVETTNGFRWGLGAGLPSRRSLRLTAELTGATYSEDTLRTKQPIFSLTSDGGDGSFLP